MSVTLETEVMPERQEVLESSRVDGDDRFVLALPPGANHVRTARLLAAVARHFGVADERIEDTKLAVSEAFTNAIRAHAAAAPAEPVRVLVRLQARALRFEVVDAGGGFDVGSPDAGLTPPAGISEGSLGLSLLRSLFPEVAITRNADRGMTVSFEVEL